VPVTVLSRCLQFNLKRLSREQIEAQLRHILQQEKILFDDESLSLLARGADGSMRDGLSLLDQAIAYGGGAVKGPEVRAMIGTVGADQIYHLIEALAAQEGAALLRAVDEMTQLATDFTTAMQELLAMLHQISLLQMVPGFVPDEAFDGERLGRYAELLSPEDVQLFYQIALIGQRELSLAPDPRSGFEMVLLRMLAFRPDGPPESAGGNRSRSRSSPGAAPTQARPAAKPAAVRESQAKPAEPAPKAAPEAADIPAADPAQWDSFVARLKLGGIASQLAHHCIFEQWDGETLSLLLDDAHRHLRVAQAEARLLEGISRLLGKPVKLKITEAVPEGETPAMRQAREQSERQRQAEEAMASDPLVREMEEHFSARLVSDSVRPVD
jgi:DNA polymerase III subunit gamma/tau